MGGAASTMDLLSPGDLEFLKSTSPDRERLKVVKTRSEEDEKAKKVCDDESPATVESVTSSILDLNDKKEYTCTVCNMKFTHLPAYKRHLDFSSIHNDNIIKIKTNKKNSEIMTSSIRHLANSTRILPTCPWKRKWVQAIQRTIAQRSVNATRCDLIKRSPQSVEGVDHFKIASTSKIFWTLQLTIHLDIYLHARHQSFSVIEIIPYDAKMDMELHRIYLNASVLSADPTVALQSQAEIDEKLEERRLLGAKDRFAELIPVEQIIMTAKKSAMIRIAVDRLDFEPPLRSVYNQLVYQSPIADVDGNLIDDATILSPPEDIRPIYVCRTAQYIASIKSDEVISRLNAAKHELMTCTNAAERHHALAEISVACFQPPKQDTLEIKKIGRKIIIQNAVKKTRGRLQAIKDEQTKTTLLPKQSSPAEMLANTLISSKTRAPIMLKRTTSIVTDLMCNSASVPNLSPTKNPLHTS